MRKRRRSLFYRRRRPVRRSIVVPLVVFLLAVVAVAAVMAATLSSGTRRGASASQGQADPTAPGAARAHGRRDQADLRAIAAVLRYTQFVARGTPRRRVVALSFDDGPSPYTPQVVTVLTRLHAPATFFVVGQQLRYFANGVRDELRRGFEIGDHTQNHAWLIRLRASAQRAQIEEDAAALRRLGAPAVRLFRPPYGAYNTATLATLRRLRMLMVLWSIDPGDWRRPGAKAIVHTVLAHARPGAIVIMHDGGGDRSQTVAALPAIVRGLRRRGYRLVGLPQLLRLDPPPRHQALPRLGAA